MLHLHSLLEDAVDTFDVSRPDTRRFRASTVDEALAEAKSDLGGDVEIVEANRIRRGGVGGFFATDLGVELVVTSPRPRATGSGGLGIPTPRPSTDVPNTPAARTAPAARVASVTPAAPTTPVTPVTLVTPVTPPAPAADDPLFRWFDEMMNENVLGHGAATTGTADDTADTSRTDDTADTSFLPVDLVDDDSFARHLERQMWFDTTPTDRSDPIAVRTPVAPVAPVAPAVSVAPVAPRAPEAHVAPAAPVGEMPAVSDPAPVGTDAMSADADPVRSERSPARRVMTFTRPARPEAVAPAPVAPEPDAPEPNAPEPNASEHDALTPAILTDGSRPAARDEQAFDRPTGLVADAVNSLVSQLSQTTPVEGSGIARLRRVEVTLTTAQGDVIQMAAELGAD